MAHAVVADMAGHAPVHRLPREARPERRVPAGVGVDDRHPPRHAGVGADLPGVADRVHQPVAVVDALRGHSGEGDGGLAVVERRRGQDAAHGDIAVGDIPERIAGHRGCLAVPVIVPRRPEFVIRGWSGPQARDRGGLGESGVQLPRGLPRPFPVSLRPLDGDPDVGTATPPPPPPPQAARASPPARVTADR